VHKNRQSKQIAVTNTREPLSIFFIPSMILFVTEAMTNFWTKHTKKEEENHAEEITNPIRAL